MITKITTVDELKQIFLEVLLTKTDKINDVGNESVLNGLAYGSAKIGQKALVNISVIEGHLFPDTAYGEYLDNLARLRGIAPRFGAEGSSTYVRLSGTPGTFYSSDTLVFTSLEGITFTLESDVTIDVNGFAYAKVKSDVSGLRTNVSPLSINRVAPVPAGHVAVTNEYGATGGRDEEDDALFRLRIKTSVNELARGTLAYLEQVFMKINNKVLRLHKGGTGADGRLNIIVVSVNGQDFTQDEFNEILNQSEDYLSLTELLRGGNDYALQLLNVDWLPVDVDFRVDIDPAYDRDSVRTSIQVQMQKLFDYRFWKYGEKVSWDNLLYAAQNVEGVRYVPNAHFNPSSDINVPEYRLPRIRSFVMRDLNGNIVEDNNGVLADFYYPNEPDINFQESVLTSI